MHFVKKKDLSIYLYFVTVTTIALPNLYENSKIFTDSLTVEIGIFVSVTSSRRLALSKRSNLSLYEF